MNHKFLVLCAGCLLTFTTHNSAFAQNDFQSWNRFRGANGTGRYQGAPLPVQFGPKQNVLWSTELPAGISSPCIWKDRIFLTGFDNANNKLLTICMNRKTGKFLWTKSVVPTQRPRIHPLNSPAASTPTTDGKLVYSYFGSYGIVCYDLEGDEIWTKKLSPSKNRHGSASSPILYKNLLILVRDKGGVFVVDGSSQIFALNKETGEYVWIAKRAFAGTGWSTPTIWKHKKGTDLVVLGKRVIAYDPNTGKKKWWVDGLIDYSVTSPVFGENRLFVCVAAGGLDEQNRIVLPKFAVLVNKFDRNRDKFIQPNEIPKDYLVYRGDSKGVDGDTMSLLQLFRLVDLNHDGKLGEKEWIGFQNSFLSDDNGLFAIRAGGTGNITRTHVAWKTTRYLPEVPSPLYYNGHLYLIKNGGIVTCWNEKTGKTVYRRRLGVDSAFFASPVVGNGKIYVASHKGVIAVFETGSKMKVLARNDLGESIVATPAIAQGCLYVRTEKRLYAFHR